MRAPVPGTPDERAPDEQRRGGGARRWLASVCATAVVAGLGVLAHAVDPAASTAGSDRPEPTTTSAPAAGTPAPTSPAPSTPASSTQASSGTPDAPTQPTPTAVQPTSDGQPPVYTAPDPADYADAAAALPAELVQALTQDLGVDAATYLAQSDAARAASATVAALDPQAAWVAADNTLHVVVPDEAAAQQATAAGAIAQVGDPLGEEAASRTAAGDGRTYVADRWAGTVVSFDSSSMRTADLADGTVSGGTGYVVQRATDTVRCSLGFFGTGAFGQKVNLTAGHCVETAARTATIRLYDLAAPTQAGGALRVAGTLGWPGTGEIGDGEDAGLLNLDGQYTATPTVATWGGGTLGQDAGDPVSVWDATPAVAGMPVCTSGSTTGWTCGRVLDAQTTVTVGDGNGGIAGQVTAFLFDACVLPGDSGGPVVSGHYAVGVDSFTNMGSCEHAGVDGYFSGGFAVVGGSTNAETMFGQHFNLDVAVGAPRVTATSTTLYPQWWAKLLRLGTVTVSGTVDAAVGARVDVLVDGFVAGTATVGAGGSWHATLCSLLWPGRHFVSATASVQPAGSDLVTTSSATRSSFSVPW